MNEYNKLEGFLEDTFFQRNEEQVNRLVCKGVAYASLVFPLMVLLNAIGIFRFTSAISVLVLIIGFFCTLSPMILQRVVKNQIFTKYYVLICIIVLVSVLATQYHIGIYITLILAPIISCLYFDRKFTIQIVLLSFVGFLIGWYFRCIQLRDALYPGETVWATYIPFVFGFVIEFGVALFFLSKLAERTHTFLVEQKEMLVEMEKKDAKIQLVLNATKDILFEYNIEENFFSSNGSIWNWTRKDIEIENFTDYIRQIQWKTNDFIDAVKRYSMVSEEDGNRFQEEICLSFSENGTENGKDYVIWAYFELSVLRNSEGKAKTIVGKLRDITQQKLDELQADEMKKFDTLSGMYNYASFRKIIEERGQSGGKSHELMIVHIRNYAEITECYGDVYRDFIMVSVAEAIKNVAQGEGVLPCRLSDTVFLVYIENVDLVDNGTMQRDLNQALGSLYVGEKDVDTVSYDFSYYLGEEKLEELVSIALRYVDAKEFATEVELDMKEEESPLIAVASTEETFHQLSEERRQEEGENLITNIAALVVSAKDFRSAIQMALAQVGRFFELDGIRIYEFNDTTQTVLPDFTWAVDTETAKECKDVVLDYEIRHFFTENFGKSRVVDNTIGAFQDFFRQFGENPFLLHEYSTLICPITVESSCHAVILYDMKENDYTWSDQQKELLLSLAKILGNDILALQQDSANKARSTFLANMSYEVRSPIHAIMGLTELARGELQNTDRVRECLDSIDRSSEKLINIVTDTFDLAKMELGKMKLTPDVFSMEDLLAQVEEQTQYEASKKQTTFLLERKFKENFLYGDATRIYQVISYLVENAVRTIQTGGSVYVLAEEREHNGSEVSMYFAISEIGGETDDEVRQQLFADLEQGKDTNIKKHNGTGLDLAVCYHLVQMMGGTLEIDNDKENTTTFHFVLKLEVPSKESTVQYLGKQKENTDEIVSLDGRKILLAEDNLVSAEVVKRLLELEGALVTVALDGEECVKQYWQSRIEEYDFILMDVHMPKMNGYEATRDIRACGRQDALDIPIIAMTANAFDEDVQEAMDAGMDAHLAKPVQLRALLKEVGKLLSKKQSRGEKSNGKRSKDKCNEDFGPQ